MPGSISRSSARSPVPASPSSECGGYFLSGAPHGVGYLRRDGVPVVERQRLAGNTLLVQRDGVLVHVEGRLDRRRALAWPTPPGSRATVPDSPRRAQTDRQPRDQVHAARAISRATPSLKQRGHPSISGT